MQITTLRPAKWRMRTKGTILIRKAAMQDTCPESTGRALAYPVFPHEEIGKGIVGENGTLEGYRWGHKETDEFIFGEEHFGQKPHDGTIHGCPTKGGKHELQISEQFFLHTCGLLTMERYSANKCSTIESGYIPVIHTQGKILHRQADAFKRAYRNLRRTIRDDSAGSSLGLTSHPLTRQFHAPQQAYLLMRQIHLPDSAFSLYII